jgi:hypothetical protein
MALFRGPIVEEPEGDLTRDDTAQQVLLHPLLHLGTGHVTGQRVLLRALALTAAPPRHRPHQAAPSLHPQQEGSCMRRCAA